MDFLSADYTGVITHARIWDNTRKVCKSQALIFQVVQSCISCLGAVVNKVTHNIRLVKDYFLKYHGKSQFPSRIPVLIFSVNILGKDYDERLLFLVMKNVARIIETLMIKTALQLR